MRTSFDGDGSDALRITAWLLDKPHGATRGEVSDEFRLSHQAAAHQLRNCRLAGSVVVVGKRNRARWVHKTHQAEAEAAYREAVKSVADAKVRAVDERNAERMAAGLTPTRNVLMVQQILVCANKAAPLAKTGPNSVFELASMLGC